MGAFDIKLGERIKMARKEFGYTQIELAGQIGVNRAAIVQIEKGVRKVYAHELLKLGNLFGVTVEDVVNPAYVLGKQVPFCPLTQKKCREDCAWRHFELGCIVGKCW
jgi:DNA-binding XRE family transcriptional regulator